MRPLSWWGKAVIVDHSSRDFPSRVGNAQRLSKVAKRRNNRVWSTDDTERLRLHIEGGGSAARAMVIFKRSEQAVREHARTFGWRFPTILLAPPLPPVLLLCLCRRWQVENVVLAVDRAVDRQWAIIRNGPP